MTEIEHKLNELNINSEENLNNEIKKNVFPQINKNETENNKNVLNDSDSKKENSNDIKDNKNVNDKLKNETTITPNNNTNEKKEHKKGRERKHSKHHSKKISRLEKKKLYSHLNIIKDSSLESFVEYILQNNIKNVIVMTGAGISTSAGIPDFRTPKSGLYDNLQQYNLPYPEAIFDIDYFRENPKPFLTLAKSLYPGRFRPTPSHYFIKLLADKGLLLRLYTQNIDTLERISGIPEDLLIEAHGSFNTAHCIGQGKTGKGNKGCNKVYTKEFVRDIIFNDEIPYCLECGGLIKPDIVFFGEDLPIKFFENLENDFKKCDLLIVIGTSLNVQPFCSIIDLVSPKVPRCLINLMEVGVLKNPHHGFDFTGEYQKFRRDAFFKGTCDDGCIKMAKLLGYEDDLKILVN